MPQLHQDLIVEIFLRLPVNTLLRFQCLSKSFHALIDSPNFINWHLARSSSRNSNPRKLIFTDALSRKFCVCDANVDLEEGIIGLGKPVSSLVKEVLGYCNGLVLLKGEKFEGKFGFDVWNPSTRKYRKVPVFPFKAKYNVDIIGSGLGYDDSIDDYKVILIVNIVRKSRRGVQVWIYGLKLKNWRKAENFSYLGVSNQNCPGFGYFTDGSMHWLCEEKSEIVAFDVRKETFSLVPQLVCSINSVEGVSSKLHVLKGCLCISYCSWNEDGGNQADLYTRKKEGVLDQFAWTKLYSITEALFSDVNWFVLVKVLGYSDGGDKIVLDLCMDYMAPYDVEKKSVRKLEIDQMDRNWDNSSLCFVVESLAPGGDGM